MIKKTFFITILFLSLPSIAETNSSDNKPPFGKVWDVRDIIQEGRQNVSVLSLHPELFPHDTLMYVFRGKDQVATLKSIWPFSSNVKAVVIEGQVKRNDIVVKNPDDIFSILEDTKLQKVSFNDLFYSTFNWVCDVEIYADGKLYEKQTRKFTFNKYIEGLQKKNEYYEYFPAENIEYMEFTYRDNFLSGSKIVLKKSEGNHLKENSVIEIIAPDIQNRLKIPAAITGKYVMVKIKPKEKKDGTNVDPHHLKIDMKLGKIPSDLKYYQFLFLKSYANANFVGEVIIEISNLELDKYYSYYIPATDLKNGDNTLEFFISGGEKINGFYFDKSESFFVGKADFNHNEKTPSIAIKIENKRKNIPEIVH